MAKKKKKMYISVFLVSSSCTREIKFAFKRCECYLRNSLIPCTCHLIRYFSAAAILLRLSNTWFFFFSSFLCHHNNFLSLPFFKKLAIFFFQSPSFSIQLNTKALIPACALLRNFYFNFHAFFFWDDTNSRNSLLLLYSWATSLFPCHDFTFLIFAQSQLCHSITDKKY